MHEQILITFFGEIKIQSLFENYRFNEAFFMNFQQTNGGKFITRRKSLIQFIQAYKSSRRKKKSYKNHIQLNCGEKEIIKLEN
jgi:hypothetical protein